MNNALTKKEFLKQVRLSLGGNIVSVELTPDHYDLALNLALMRYRQRSSNATEERVAFLDLQPDQYEYTLPSEIIEVRKINRRGTTGTASGTGAYFDSFGAAFINQMAIGGSPNTGGLLTFELYSEYQELVGRMFGLHINFVWDSASHKLQINRHIKAPETVLLDIQTIRSDEVIINDLYAKPWIFDYTVAKCKEILGEARGKFSVVVGPQSGVTLNGDSLKAEAQAELVRLEEELKKQVDQDIGYGFTIG